jgi:hypothetical protein
MARPGCGGAERCRQERRFKIDTAGDLSSYAVLDVVFFLVTRVPRTSGAPLAKSGQNRLLPSVRLDLTVDSKVYNVFQCPVDNRPIPSHHDRPPASPRHAGRRSSGSRHADDRVRDDPSRQLLVLLAAREDLMNLLLARTSSRSREIAIRTSIGASQLQIGRQLMAEGLVIGVPGAAGGVLLAQLVGRRAGGCPDQKLHPDCNSGLERVDDAHGHERRGVAPARTCTRRVAPYARRPREMRASCNEITVTGASSRRVAQTTAYSGLSGACAIW